MSLQEIETAIVQLNKPEQQKLLSDLPQLINLKREDISYLKVAEPSFEFWENSEDVVYDKL